MKYLRRVTVQWEALVEPLMSKSTYTPKTICIDSCLGFQCLDDTTEKAYN